MPVKFSAQKLVLSILSIFVLVSASAQKITTAEYIQQWAPTAVSNMDQYGVPASIILAQGLLESGVGNSELARNGNNHFGIKCHGWSGKKIYHDDDKKGECFRKYPTAQNSFDDHVKFLSGSKRYASLFDLKKDDYKRWAKGLKAAGYATNPKYPQLLINIIEENNLSIYDNPKTRPDMDAVVKHDDVDEVVADNDDDTEDNSKSKPQVTSNTGYPVKISDNNIKYVVARGGEEMRPLADALLLNEWQLKKYNDLTVDYKFSEGERVYIQPKRRKSKTEKIKIKEASTLREVSQVFGVKMKHLKKYNPNLSEDGTLPAGEIVWLQKH
tara:strand:- start:199487 stop:200467 length:981 start_codon:yes stop_codon:yes gene_type:complete